MEPDEEFDQTSSSSGTKRTTPTLPPARHTRTALIATLSSKVKGWPVVLLPTPASAADDGAANSAGTVRVFQTEIRTRGMPLSFTLL
jgi:hypothetical protein